MLANARRDRRGAPGDEQVLQVERRDDRVVVLALDVLAVDLEVAEADPGAGVEHDEAVFFLRRAGGLRRVGHHVVVVVARTHAPVGRVVHQVEAPHVVAGLRRYHALVPVAAGVSEPPKLYIAEPLKPFNSARYTIELFMRMPGVL